jgi:putative membrane protein
MMRTLAAHSSDPSTIVAGWWLTGLLVTGPALLYLVGVARTFRAGGRGWSGWRVTGLVVGLAAVGVAVSPLVDGWAHADARGHMAQHLLLGMLAPVALVLAAPVTLLLRAAGPRLRRRVGSLLASRAVHGLGHPVTAAALHVGGIFSLYLTPVYEMSTRSPAVHHLVHVHLLLAGYLFAWSIAGPDPAPRRPGVAVRLLVLVLAGAAHAYLAKLMYARAPDLPPGNPYGVAELQQAAQWMYYGGDVAEVLLAAALLTTWYRRRGHREAHTARGTTVGRSAHDQPSGPLSVLSPGSRP